MSEPIRVKHGRIRGSLTLLWAAVRVLFRPRETEEMLYRALQLREKCREIERAERHKKQPHFFLRVGDNPAYYAGGGSGEGGIEDAVRGFSNYLRAELPLLAQEDEPLEIFRQDMTADEVANLPDC